MFLTTYIVLFIDLFVLKANETLPSVDAIQRILPVYSKLVSQPPKRANSVKPYLPVNEPEQALTPRYFVSDTCCFFYYIITRFTLREAQFSNKL